MGRIVDKKKIPEKAANNPSIWTFKISNIKVMQMNLIPPTIFATQPRGGPGGRSASTSPSPAATLLTLNRLLEHLSVTQYQLALLLGMTPSHVWVWWNDGGCPSSMHWTRIMQLVLMQAEGVAVYQMRSIDWTTGEIKWRDGSATRQGKVSEWSEPVQDTMGQNNSRLAEVPDQRAGQDGALPRSAAYHPKNDPGPVY